MYAGLYFFQYIFNVNNSQNRDFIHNRVTADVSDEISLQEQNCFKSRVRLKMEMIGIYFLLVLSYFEEKTSGRHAILVLLLPSLWKGELFG